MNTLNPRDYTDTPDHDDACMVCDKIDCICPPEEEFGVCSAKGETSTGDVSVPAPVEPPSDSWEAIEKQLDYWADMDAAYWLQRKEKEYTKWLERTYGI